MPDYPWMQGYPKEGKYLECEMYTCNLLKRNLQLSTNLQVSEIDIAHSLPSDKGTPITVKFLRCFHKNDIYSRKKMLKGTGITITEVLTKRRMQLIEAAKRNLTKKLSGHTKLTYMSTLIIRNKFYMTSLIYANLQK